MELDLSVIPAGLYCYNDKGLCPYWEHRGEGNAYCKLLQRDDESAEHTSLLWDQVKECGIHDATEVFKVVAFGLKDGTAELVRKRIQDLLETEFNVMVEEMKTVQIQVVQQGDFEGVYVCGNWVDQPLGTVTMIFDAANIGYKIHGYRHEATHPENFPTELGMIFDELVSAPPSSNRQDSRSVPGE